MTAPDRSDDFDRGVANRRAVLGDEWVDRSLANATDFNAAFQSLITRYAWHEIWGRPGLDHETRRLLVLGMTMGLARWEEFELHCRAAIRGGVALAKIQETLLQGAIYCVSRCRARVRRSCSATRSVSISTCGTRSRTSSPRSTR